MALSASQMERLETLYEHWGADWVRAELDKGNRNLFVNAEVTEFAHAWLEAQDIRRRKHKEHRFIAIAAAIGLIAGLALAW